jgi:hypothetical protein
MVDRNKWTEPERMQRLVFGFDVLSKSLTVYASKEHAITQVEGLSITEGDWRFFSADGSPLQARFSVPAKVNAENNTYSNGVYTLESSTDGENLFAILSIVECEDRAGSGLLTLRDIEQFLIDQALEKESQTKKV